MCVLEGLEPAAVFHYFEKICGIPHTSFHEKELSDYCVSFAKERNLYCEQDELGNVLIIAPATAGYEKKEPLILQGHLDMVGDKTADCDIDLLTEGLRLRIDGDLIYAEGTTLGGDDGLAVAYALAILDSDDIPHPRLEVVLTVSEEVGMLGAAAIDLSSCRGRRILNLDSEEEGVFTVGCSGGIRVRSDLPMTRKKASGTRLDFTFEGLLGGHSGIEINKGLANANVLGGRFFSLLEKHCPFDIIAFKGGVKENVIPKDASFSVLVKESELDSVQSALTEFHTAVAAEYGATDAHAALTMINAGQAEADVLDDASAMKLITALNLTPNGVQAMCADLPGLVETSLNLGIATLTDDNLSLSLSIRSSVPTAKTYLTDKVVRFTKHLGGTVDLAGDYPAWPFMRESAFRDECVEIFKKQYGHEPEIVTVHAGLECGIFSDKLPGLECISIGPDLKDIHTVKETASISSIARVWEFIKAVLAY